MSVEVQMTGRELLDRWIKALRSGNYKQGNGTLYNTKSDQYCCLGVLGRECGESLDVLGKLLLPTIHQDWWKLRNLAVTPPAVTAPAGVSPIARRVLDSYGKHTPITKTCSILNDIAGWNFNQIADWLDSTEIRTAIENHIDKHVDKHIDDCLDNPSVS